MRNDVERLKDILEAIIRIERYAIRGKGTFEQDELIQNWITSNLQTIGESSNSISQDVRNAHPEIPWRKIIGMRHVLVHRYFEVDIDTVWSVVEDDLPNLKEKVEAILQRLQNAG